MINRVILQGYIGDDPEIRSFESGSKMARMRIATNETIHIRKSGQSKQHTEWHTIISWGTLAEFADKNIRKGSLVYVEGALRYREWSNKEGVAQRVVEIAATKLDLIKHSKDSKIEVPQANTPEIIPPKDDLDNLPF